MCESTLMRVPRSSLLLLSSVMMAHHVLASHHCWAAACAGCCCVRQVLGHIISPEREWHGSILCCYWLQYQLHRQLKQVGKQACAGRTVLNSLARQGCPSNVIGAGCTAVEGYYTRRVGWCAPVFYERDPSHTSPVRPAQSLKGQICQACCAVHFSCGAPLSSP